MVDYETGEEIHKISPEWLGVPESKEALRKKKKSHNDKDMSRHTGVN